MWRAIGGVEEDDGANSFVADIPDDDDDDDQGDRAERRRIPLGLKQELTGVGL
jgi:hypothetical protein